MWVSLLTILFLPGNKYPPETAINLLYANLNPNSNMGGGSDLRYLDISINSLSERSRSSRITLIVFLTIEKYKNLSNFVF